MKYQGDIEKESNAKIYSNTGNRDVLQLVPVNAKYILDIGCGDGSLARLLVKQNCIVDGITLSEIEREEAAKSMRKVCVHNAENGLPFEGLELYDVIICSHVLEHICYPQKLMNDMHRLLRSGGIIIVALPNIMHYSSRWSLMKGNFNYQDAGLWDYTHFRWYTFETGKQLLEQNNFTVVKATVTGDLPINSFFKKVFSVRISQLIFSYLIKFSKGFFGYQLLYTAVKKTLPIKTTRE